MASIRRTLSPVPRPGARPNGDASSTASPLSRTSSSVQIPLQSSGSSCSLHNSLDYVLYRAHNFILGFFSHRSSRALERSKPKRQIWRRALLHFSMFFILGFFIGLTPFASMNLQVKLMPKHQPSFFNMMPSMAKYQSVSVPLRNATDLVVETHMRNVIPGKDINNNVSKQSNESISDRVGVGANENVTANLFTPNRELVIRKLLIVVTPTHSQPFQAYYLNRLAQTLKQVPPPLLWIVVETTLQSAETADILRKTGVMYRHLVCDKNVTEMKDKNVHQRNVALLHIEKHHLDGIVYFADENNVYSIDLFEQLRQIRRFGTWKVAKFSSGHKGVVLEGPICNRSEVVGWKTNEITRRFHAEISGFAFNSTILWDPNRWHRPIPEPIRQLDTVKGECKVSTLMEQIVEDESEMEGLLGDSCSTILVWHLPLH